MELDPQDTCNWAGMGGGAASGVLQVPRQISPGAKQPHMDSLQLFLFPCGFSVYHFQLSSSSRLILQSFTEEL